jgi:hypothetical protein
MKASHIQLYSALFVPKVNGDKGGITLQRTVHGGPQGYPGIEMEVTALGVVCEFRGTKWLIPMNAVQAIVLEDEVVNVKQVAKKG